MRKWGVIGLLALLILGFGFAATTMIIGDKITTGTIDAFLINVDSINNNLAGFIGFSDKRLSNVLDPVEDQDAVTKGYLDSLAQSGGGGGSGDLFGLGHTIIDVNGDRIIAGHTTNTSYEPFQITYFEGKTEKWSIWLSVNLSNPRYSIFGGLLDAKLDNSGNVYVLRDTKGGQLRDRERVLEKYDPDGNLLWSTLIDLSDFPSKNGVVEGWPSLVLTGDQSPNVYLQIDHPANNLPRKIGENTGFIYSFDPAIGTQSSVKSFENAADIEWPTASSASRTDVVGLSGGDGDTLIMRHLNWLFKYDSDLNLVWSKEILPESELATGEFNVIAADGPRMGYSNSYLSYSIELATDGKTTVVVNTVSGQDDDLSTGYNVVYKIHRIVEFDMDGNKVWSKEMPSFIKPYITDQDQARIVAGGQLADAPPEASGVISQLAIDPEGNVYTRGETRSYKGCWGGTGGSNPVPGGCSFSQYGDILKKFDSDGSFLNEQLIRDNIGGSVPADGNWRPAFGDRKEIFAGNSNNILFSSVMTSTLSVTSNIGVLQERVL